MNRRLRLRTTVICVLALGIAAAAALGLNRKPASAAPLPPVRVSVAAARTVVVEIRTRLFGEVRGDTEQKLFAELPGRVREVHVTEGEVVRAGAPIVTLDADLASADEAQARAAVSVATLERDRLARELDRVRALYAVGATPGAQVEQLEAALDSAGAQIDQLGATARAATARRSRMLLRAPQNGRVAFLRATAGDMVSPAAPIAIVMDATRVRVRAEAIERDVPRLTVGMAAWVSRPGDADKRMGEITLIAPALHPVTRTAAVEISLANEDGALMPGMLAQVDVVLDRHVDAIVIPARAALLSATTGEDGRAEVYIVRSGRSRLRSVRLGARQGDDVEVLDGLEDGESVVVEGQHLLHDDMPVEAASIDGADPVPDDGERGR